MFLLNNEQKIIEVHGHYEVHTKNGEFVSSGATWNECYNDLKKMIKAEALILQNTAMNKKEFKYDF